MSVAATIGNKAVSALNAAVNAVVLLAVLALLVFGCYAIWARDQVFRDAEATRYQQYQPQGAHPASFDDLRAINPEVVAWLTVYGTHIDYPVAQGPDNLKYLDTDATGQFSLSGAIFLDYRDHADFTDLTSILYGHHMDEQAMFGEIGLFAATNYFDAHRYGTLFYDGRTHGIEFFAFLHVDAYDSSVFRPAITRPDEQRTYLDLLTDTATHLRPDVRVTATDHLVLLSTCSDNTTNGRDVLVGRITDTVSADPFATSGDQSTRVRAIDGAENVLCRGGVFAIAGLTAVLFLLIVAVVAVIRSRRRRPTTNR
ncbi:MAG: class B sortase [Micrococcales bacterium]|nr:class B sortase [Micrococcales bacterium]